VADYNGAVPVATYTLTDGSGTDDTSTLSITIDLVNDAPVVGSAGITTRFFRYVNHTVYMVPVLP